MAFRRPRKDDGDVAPEDDTTTDSAADASAEAAEAAEAPSGPSGPGVRSVLVPTLVIALVAVLTVGTLVSAFRSFRPHSMKVVVAADQQSVEFFQQQLGKGSDPIFDIQAVPEGETPTHMVQTRQAYAALVLGVKAWQLQYAGANGTIMNSQLQATFQPADPKITYRAVDLVPAAKGDKSGWSVFCLVLAVVLAAIGFGLLLGFRRQRMDRRTELLSLVQFAAIVGIATTLVVRYPFDALGGNPVVPCILQGLLAFSVAGLTLACVRLGRVYGAGLAVFLFVAVGTGLSGSLLPPPYLPAGFWQAMVNVVPNGMAAQGTTGASYFGGASFGVGLYGLVGWTIGTLVVLALADRFGPKRAQADESAAGA